MSTVFIGTSRVAIALAILALAACGGGGSGPPPSYTVGGTVSGLSGLGLVLRDNGGGNLTITSNGSFTFATRVRVAGAGVATDKKGGKSACPISHC